MNAVVLDSSALMRMLLPDGPLPADAEEALHRAERGDLLLLAPELALAEGVQVLHKKRQQGRISADEQKELLVDLLSIPLRLFSHKPLLARAMALAHEQALSVYDALFLALAEEFNVRLITADAKLLRAAERMHLG
ncbi:MAG: type II toxin-antitoxin system VapC family toxin [bacterium]|nr:type II toxin-antitoxin system VapC family toxin [bacterium]